MQSTNKEHIAYLAEYYVQAGLTDVVISPGSRNAPLIIAFESHPKIKTYLIHDERVAAFVALGLAEAKNETVALTCTSGSALLNYSPALVEAFYRQIPLVVFSADRPLELIDQGDGQTIRQNNVYQNFIKQSFVFDSQNYIKTSKSIFDALLNEPLGPVHVNLPLQEPLYDTAEIESFPINVTNKSSTLKLSISEKDLIEKEWGASSKRLIIIGQNGVDLALSKIIDEIANDPTVAILVENTSNIQNFKKIVHCIDRTLEAIGESALDDFRPDLIVSLGGAVISKRIKGFLRNCKPTANWRVGNFTIDEDTYQNLTHAFEIEPKLIFEFVLENNFIVNSNFGSKWKQNDLMANEVHASYMENAPFSDLVAFDIILDSIPENINLHMGNSSVVRYCQLFNPVPSHTYYSNRGVSGIDGCVSTAAGFSMVQKDKLNVLIIGDISFFYDSNAFWNQYLGYNLKVIVIKNGGGGIFQIIDGPAKSEQSQTFFAPFDASIKGVCDTYNLDYMFSDSKESLSKSFEQFLSYEKDGRPVVLEVNTENMNNAEVLRDYFKAIAEVSN